MTHGHTVHTEFAHCKTWMIKIPTSEKCRRAEIGKPRPMGQIQPVIGSATVQEQSRAVKWLGEKIVAIYFMTCENAMKFKCPGPYIKFDWNPTTIIHVRYLWLLCTAVAELRSHHRDGTACKA